MTPPRLAATPEAPDAAGLLPFNDEQITDAAALSARLV
jgi:hypothetical protein